MHWWGIKVSACAFTLEKLWSAPGCTAPRCRCLTSWTPPTFSWPSSQALQNFVSLLPPFSFWCSPPCPFYFHWLSLMFSSSPLFGPREDRIYCLRRHLFQWYLLVNWAFGRLSAVFLIFYNQSGWSCSVKNRKWSQWVVGELSDLVCYWNWRTMKLFEFFGWFHFPCGW